MAMAVLPVCRRPKSIHAVRDQSESVHQSLLILFAKEHLLQLRSMMAAQDVQWASRCCKCNRTFIIHRFSQWINHSSDQCIANRNIHHTTCSFYFIACIQQGIFAKKYRTNFIFINIISNAG